MKILVYSDIHLHNWTQFGKTEEGISKRLAEQKRVLAQIRGLNDKRGINLNLFIGDWWHTTGNHPTDVMLMTEEYFRHNRIPHIIVDGNHDLVKMVNPHYLHNAANLLKQLAADYDENNYGPDSRPKIKIVNFQDEIDYDTIKGYDIVALHKQPDLMTEYGFHMEGVDWKRLAKQNKLVFFGHYHTRKQLADNCWVVGSPMHLTFGDKGDRGVYIIDTSTWQVEFVKIDSPAFVTVDKPDQVKDDGNYYKVLDGQGMEPADNIIGVKVPKMYEERIKSDNFTDMLGEWLKMNDKDPSSMQVIEDVVKDKVSGVRKLFTGRLTHVSIKDFMSAGDVDYELKDGFIFIAGDSGTDKAGSNGSGKSTITGEAIYWALFGETTKGLTGDDVIRRGQKNCKVSLQMRCDNGVMHVSRSRKEGLSVRRATTTGQQDLTEGLRQAERQKILEQVLGFDKKVFLASCYFSQENLLMLTGMTDNEKTDMITSLLGFEEYDDLYEKTSQKQKDFGVEREKIAADRLSVEMENAVLTSKIDMNDKMIGDYSAEIDNQKVRIVGYEKEIADTKHALRQMDAKDVEKDTTDYEATLADMEEAKNAARESVAEFDKQLVDGKYDFKIRELTGRIGKLKGENTAILNTAADLDAEIKAVEKAEVGIRCGKCGAMVSHENIAAFIEEKHQAIVKIKTREVEIGMAILNIQTALQQLEKDQDKVKDDRKAAEKHMDDIVSKIDDAYRAKEAQAKAKEQAERNKLALKKDIEGWEKSISIADQMIAGNMDKIAKLRDELKQQNRDLESAKTKMADADQKIDKIDKGVEVLDFWKTAFSPKGIRSVLLDRFCNSFNQVCNDYLAMSSHGMMSIQVSPTATTKAGEERNKISLNVLMRGEDVRYESLSGGEKRRVDIALCLALNKFIANKYGIPHGILGLIVLDEIFSYIDSEGEEAIATLIYNEAQDKTIFVISHTPALSSYAKAIWRVIKENGVSRLETT